MNIEQALRLIAGIMILLSLIMALVFHLNWLWFTTFIAVNLIQSAFTNWCPMISILKGLGLRT